jgi:hypothetical protein
MMHAEALALRAILTVDSNDSDALGHLLGDLAECPGCTATTITHLAACLVDLMDAGYAAGTNDEGWRTVLAQRLARLLDVLAEAKKT